MGDWISDLWDKKISLINRPNNEFDLADIVILLLEGINNLVLEGKIQWDLDMNLRRKEALEVLNRSFNSAARSSQSLL